jgi:hypothetical protein
MFAEPERIAAFAHAGQGTERFRLSVGSFVTISAFASKNEDTVQFVALRIDAG